MKICVIGAGRMGRILAARMSAEHEVSVYDANSQDAKVVAESLKLKVIDSLAEMDADAVVLAVPDSAVGPCINELHKTHKHWNVFSVATTISREMLAVMPGNNVRRLNVKIIGHAGEINRGSQPVIVIDNGDDEMVQMAQQIFALVGKVLCGEADQVKQINSVATGEALRAAVEIERVLKAAGIVDSELIRGALSQVAPGVLRAYAEDDLGPFARNIVNAIRDRADMKMV